MSGEIRIEFVHGHADVWRLSEDPAQLREIAEALVEPFRRDGTKVAGIASRGAAGLFPGPKSVAEATTGATSTRSACSATRLRRANECCSSTTGSTRS